MFKLLLLVLLFVYVTGDGKKGKDDPNVKPSNTNRPPPTPATIHPAKEKDLATLGEAILILMKNNLAANLAFVHLFERSVKILWMIKKISKNQSVDLVL